MNLFIALACVLGIFTISQAFIQALIFDFYFYSLPFGLALASLFGAAGLTHAVFFRSIRTSLHRSLPLVSALAMLACVGLFVYGTWLGVSLFFMLLVVAQLVAYLAFWSAVVGEGRLATAVAGFGAGVMVGYLAIGYLNLDPLVIVLLVAFSTVALYGATFLRKAPANAAYVLVLCFLGLSAFQAKGYDLAPTSVAWLLDYGKAGSTTVGAPKQRIWGRAGLTEMYALTGDGRDAWVYTNGASPGLVPLDDPAAYDDHWWEQKAPLTMAIYDAVRPESIVDIGSIPSEVAWRTSGTRTVYGLYGSPDWALMTSTGIGSIKRSVVLLPQTAFSAEANVNFPVDMIVVSSAHEGRRGWTSSNAGEQRFFDRESIDSYWQALAGNGVLVLLSRDQSVFFRQIFGAWAALKNAGMSDAEFLDHAWGVVPESVAADSPYRYALILTKKPRDEKFAEALKSQVLKLPVRYLFGYSIPPSRPYDYLYQRPIAEVQEIFSRGVSAMFGKSMRLDASTSRKSVFYQFVEDVYPQYKEMLVISVGALLGIILLPLQQHRRVENIETRDGPGVAATLVMGGATGAAMAVALTFLLIYPSSITNETRLLYLGLVLLLVAPLLHLYKIFTGNAALLFGLGAALVLMLYLTGFAQIVAGESSLYVIATGMVFALSGLALPIMRSSLMQDRESGSALVGWWWFAAAAGCAVAVFWSMRLYAEFGNGLFLLAGLLLLYVTGISRWHHGSSCMKEKRQCSGDTAAILESL